MKINDILNEDLDEAGPGTERGFGGFMAGLDRKVGGFTRNIQDKFSMAPEVQKNITQGINAWIAQAKRLTAAGVLSTASSSQEYANEFVKFVAKTAHLNPSDEKLTQIGQGLAQALDQKEGGIAVRDAMTSVVGLTLQGGQQDDIVKKMYSNITSKLSDTYGTLKQFKDMSIEQRKNLGNKVLELIKQSPYEKEDVLYKKAEQALTDITEKPTQSNSPAPGKAPMAPRPTNTQSAPTKPQQIPPGTTVPQGNTVWKFNGEKWFDQKGNPADRTEVVSILTKMKDDAAEKANQTAQPAASNNGRANLKGMMSNQNLRKKE